MTTRGALLLGLESTRAMLLERRAAIRSEWERADHVLSRVQVMLREDAPTPSALALLMEIESALAFKDQSEIDDARQRIAEYLVRQLTARTPR